MGQCAFIACKWKSYVSSQSDHGTDPSSTGGNEKISYFFRVLIALISCTCYSESNVVTAPLLLELQWSNDSITAKYIPAKLQIFRHVSQPYEHNTLSQKWNQFRPILPSSFRFWPSSDLLQLFTIMESLMNKHDLSVFMYSCIHFIYVCWN